ncbi:MAG: ABC transporter permease [Deltaproteobacteria bacterium]|nr:ABC transporter permease [Deltaproteobacteria bacterium]
MNNINAIFKREFKSYFATPIALIFLVVFLVLTGFFTFKLGSFYEMGQASLASFFAWHPWLYIFIVPAVSMRLWAEEKRSGTVELLFTLPVTLFEAMVAKFLAAWLFLGLALLLTFPMVLTVAYLGQPDYGPILASYIGSFFMAGAFLAVGLFVSAMTNNQVISFVVATFLCLFLVLLGYSPVQELLVKISPDLMLMLNVLSVPYHFEAIQRGVINVGNLVYFVSVILFFLVSGAVILDKSKAD